MSFFFFSSFPWFTCNADDNSTIFDKHCICCTHLLCFMCQAKSSILSSTPTWEPSSVAEVPFKTFPVERLHLGFTSAESVLLTADCKAVWSVLVCDSWPNKKREPTWLKSFLFSCWFAQLFTNLLVWTLCDSASVCLCYNIHLLCLDQIYLCVQISFALSLQ